MWGDNDRQLEAVGDIGNKGRQDGKRAYHPTEGYKKEDHARQALGKADTPFRTGALVGRQ